MALARQRSSGGDTATAVAVRRWRRCGNRGGSEEHGWQRDGGDGAPTGEAAVSQCDGDGNGGAATVAINLTLFQYAYYIVLLTLHICDVITHGVGMMLMRLVWAPL